MNDKHTLMAAFALALGLAAGGPALAGPGPEEGYVHGGHRGDMMAGGHEMAGPHAHLVDRLQLSAEQKRQLETLRTSSREEAQTLRGTVRASRLAERQAAESGASERELRKLARKTADSRVDLLLFAREQDKQFRALLIPAQLTQLDQLKAERKAHREERREEHLERRHSRQEDAGN